MKGGGAFREGAVRAIAARAVFATAAWIAAAALAAAPARADRPHVYALTHARLLVAPGKTIEDGTLVMREGIIEAAGKDAVIPPDAVRIDASGMTVHAGFIDACSRVGVVEAERGPAAGRAAAPGPGGKRKGPAGIESPITKFHPERRVVDDLVQNVKDLAKHRAMGFTSALIVPEKGIFRGTSALVSLGDRDLPHRVLKSDVAQHVAFERGGFGQGYPSSLMGVIASIRQAFADTARHDVWEARYEADPAGMPRPDLLAEYAPLSGAASGKIPVVFDTDDSATMLRALSLASELHLNAMMLGNGMEYEIASELKASGRPVILPMAFPDKPKADDPDAALDVETRTLRRFLGARSDAAKLASAGVPFALGTCKMKNPGDFLKNVRKAIDSGLAPDDALAALTVVPARLFGTDRILGSLDRGKEADVVVEEGPLFGEKTAVRRVFVDGVEYDVESSKPKGDPNAVVDPTGSWTVVLDFSGRSVTRTWRISGEKGAYKGTAETREGEVAFLSVDLAGNVMTAVLPSPGGGTPTEITVVIQGDRFEGTAEGAGGRSFEVTGARLAAPQGGRP